MDIPCGYDDRRGSVVAQIQKGMELYRVLPFPELAPMEKCQAKIDGGRIQSVNRLVQFDAEVVGGLKGSGFCDKDMREIGINPPISGLIAMGRQDIAGHLASDAQVIKFGPGCPQAGLDIPHTFPESELSEGQAEILIPSGKSYHVVVAVASLDAFSEPLRGDNS